METGLWKQFDRIVVFDTETTGIEFGRTRSSSGGRRLFRGGRDGLHGPAAPLSPGRTAAAPLSPSSPASRKSSWNRRAWRKPTPVRRSATCWAGESGRCWRPTTPQFDLNFLYHFLRPFGRADVLRAPGFLDVLTVYRDRRDYPHKLNDAITAYGLEDQAVNSHRAVDDARAAAVLLEAMAAERDDLDRYVDLFGYSPKYGVSGRRIASVEYRPQPISGSDLCMK